MSDTKRINGILCKYDGHSYRSIKLFWKEFTNPPWDSISEKWENHFTRKGIKTRRKLGTLEVFQKWYF